MKMVILKDKRQYTWKRNGGQQKANAVSAYPKRDLSYFLFTENIELELVRLIMLVFKPWNDDGFVTLTRYIVPYNY